MLQESVGIAGIKYASTFSNSGQRDVKVEIPATDLTFLCENFHVDQYGFLSGPLLACSRK